MDDLSRVLARLGGRAGGGRGFLSSTKSPGSKGPWRGFSMWDCDCTVLLAEVGVPPTAQIKGDGQGQCSPEDPEKDSCPALQLKP